ncbi:sarcosine oxidase subunit alpha family protein [Pseudoroseicyclus aestuarii]|uniref:Heterotetrameric sarcosine oxidase alpha subunit n=1 Tax=Pseudoroseicyclus aestuarii TaxID=1795041 RepID=A0A318SQG3_9RHOB|nr:sarcosine oxidase subunit alpha family protein [Pseudoroseicyclus aestuarii]PYE84120.1 heterotetrameric sarcosine oxidase alpha subunit [Pseudoroseicyclus aestuarii]
MSRRLETGGLFIDRNAPMGFTFDGKDRGGFGGDTLASALLACGQLVMGRSFKYHRQRGPVSCGAEEPNALVGLGEGGLFEPNARATITPLTEGLRAISQNRWPSLAFDIGAVNAKLSKFLPAGFYYKTFLWPRAFWKHVYEPAIRRSAGLGKPPSQPDADRYEQVNTAADVLIAGGGVAGLAAAMEAGRNGARVILMEQGPRWGGRALIDAPLTGETIDGQPAADWIEMAVDTLETMPNVTMRLHTQVSGVFDHGFALAEERCADAGPAPVRARLWRIRARRIVTAQGAIERPLAFAGNDVPGVMLAGAVRDYAVGYGVAVGERVVVVTAGDDGYRTAIALVEAGLAVPALLDVRRGATGPLVERAQALGIRIEEGRGIAHVSGGQSVTGVSICAQDGPGEVIEEIACDAVAMSGGWSPAVHLWSQAGGKLTWDEGAAMFRPDHARPPTGADGSGFVLPAGGSDGAASTEDALRSGAEAGRLAAEGGVPADLAPPQAAPMPQVWVMPRDAGLALREKMWLDFQNDVKVSDVELAAREGYRSVEHAKRYTTLGMATDQGKLSNIGGLATLGHALGEAIPQVGTTTFRPPWTPIILGSIAGSATGAQFQPVRRTPMQDWHDANGADYEPVGQWRRPYSYPREGEDREAAAQRETRAVREAVGLLDASTLGKIVVKGPDAGRFMDMIYTNMMSNLAVGRCRYGLICNDSGFLMDDGVVARLSEDTWLCHTTTGGAEHIHAHMEEWLQTEWWDWQVYTANLTEQFAQVVVAGPQARKLLDRLGGMDVSREAMPFMSWAEGSLHGFDARVFRISFSGEVSYEVSVRASEGAELWQALLEEGEDLGVTPYGTEAMHILRAEKGYVMIGEESDGTITPQDLNLGWAVSKKKADFIGKRGLTRSHLADPERPRLVGLRSLDGTVIEAGAQVVGPGVTPTGQNATEGRVTSSYHSPTFGHGIAMALIRRGPERLGETVEVTRIGGGRQKAVLVDPVLYDAKGDRLNG